MNRFNIAKVLLTTTALSSCLMLSKVSAIENDTLLYAKETMSLAGVTISPTTSLDTGTVISPKGNMIVWGFRGSGQQGNSKNVVSITAAPDAVQTFVKEKLQVVTAVGGAYHFVALDENNGVWAWGLNNYNQVGCQSGLGASSTPCRLKTDAVQIASGEYISYLLTKTGEVYSWGTGYYGQRGDGTDRVLNAGLKKVILPEKIRLLGGAYEGGYAIGYSGIIYGWGDNEDCAFGYPDPKDTENNCTSRSAILTPQPLDTHGIFSGNQVIYIAGGQSHTVVQLDNGDVYGIGRAASIGLDVRNINESNSGIPRLIMRGVESLYNRYVGSVAVTFDKKIYTWGQTGGSAFPTIYGYVPTNRPLSHLDSDEYVIKIDGGKEHFYYTTNKGKMFGVGYGAGRKLSATSSANVEWPGVRMTFVENVIKKYDNQ